MTYPLEINLLPKQTQAWDSLEDTVTTELGYGGAAGGGKTYLGCDLALVLCKEFAGCRGFIGRKELKNLKRTTLTSFFTIARDQGITDHINYNQQDSVIRFSNGSEIVLVDTAHQPSDPMFTRFGSFEFTFGWIDESNESPSGAIEILQTRIGRHNYRPEWEAKLKNDPRFRIYSDRLKRWEVKPILLETFNPNKGHVFRRYYKPYKDGSLPEYRQFIPALPNDNPYLPDSYIEGLKRADKITRERLLYGNFEYDDDDTKLMNYDAIQSLFSNFVDGGDKCIVVDVARFGRDRANIYTFSGWKVVDIESIEKSDLVYLMSRIEAKREKYQVMKKSVIVDEGGVGGGVVDMGGYVGFISNASPIERKVKWGESDLKEKKKQGVNYKNLKTQCYFYLADKVNNGEAAIACEVDEATRERIIEDLDSIKQDKIDQDGVLQIISKEKQKEILGRSPDDGDVLMMRAYFDLRPVKNIKKLLA